MQLPLFPLIYRFIVRPLLTALHTPQVVFQHAYHNRSRVPCYLARVVILLLSLGYPYCYPRHSISQRV